MSEELKLLTALCEALGFEVEKTIDKQCRDVKLKPSSYVSNIWKLSTEESSFFIDVEGTYMVELINPIITYKLKRSE